MNGIHDMGGMDGFGPIIREDNEPVFHADWERRMFALALATPFAVPYNDDRVRREIERIPPAEYLASTYYELWLRASEEVLVDLGVLGREELAGQSRPRSTGGQFTALSADEVVDAIAAGASARRPDGAPARFKPGDAVVARNLHPDGHTRLPRYVRGRRGTIDRDHGIFSFNDSNAHGRGEQPQHVYSVRFTARELWGPDAPERDTLYVDLWDAHLAPI